MTRLERARDVRTTIAELAEKAFAAFELKLDEVSGVWSCRHPHHGCHSFKLFFQPGLVVMWGDIGEYMWRHSDGDSLGWYLAQGGKGGDYPDYFLGKLRACDSAIKEFYVGDAFAYIDERLAEEEAETQDDIEGTDVNLAGAVSRWSALRTKFREYLDEQLNAEETCWYLAWTDAGFDDPPSCMGWTGSALWAWHAARTFARLHAARAVPTTITTDATTEATPS